MRCDPSLVRDVVDHRYHNAKRKKRTPWKDHNNPWRKPIPQDLQAEDTAKTKELPHCPQKNQSPRKPHAHTKCIQE